MNDDAAILHDALRAAGYERITAWHLRCVEAFLTQRETLVPVFRNRWDETHERLGFDLNNTLDELHEMALSDNTERTQRLVAAREWWMSQDADFRARILRDATAVSSFHTPFGGVRLADLTPGPVACVEPQDTAP